MAPTRLRFTLAAMAAQGRDIKLSTQRIEGYRNFGTKLWNAARFAEMNGCVRQAAFDPHQVQITLNGWIIGETAKALADVTAAIEAYRFNDAANAAYRFVWNIFCDWYLELAKPLLQGADGPAKDETRAATAFVLEEITKLPASVHAVHDRGALEHHGDSRIAPRERAGARRMAPDGGI